MERRLRRWEWIGFVFVLLAGGLLHFTYGWSGEKPLVGAFSAVNESTWEHMKLFYVPFFLFTLGELLVMPGEQRNFFAAKAWAALEGLLVIPLLFYTLQGIFGPLPTAVHLSIFLLSCAAAFHRSYRMLCRGTCSGRAWQVAGFLLLWLLLFLFVLWTYRPPQLPLFQDPISGGFGPGGAGQ